MKLHVLTAATALAVCAPLSVAAAAPAAQPTAPKAGAFTVTAKVDATQPVVGDKVTIKGNVKPAVAGAQVTIQVKYAGQKRWKTIGHDRLNAAGVQALTLSAHKLGGPKGAAALVIDKRIELEPLIAGGGHERGLRSGTENVAAIVGFGVACELAVQRQAAFAQRLVTLRERLERGLQPLGATLFAQAAQRLPNTVCFALPELDGETLVGVLDRAGYAVASGAACSSANPEASHVLRAMGVAPELARGAIRVSLGARNTKDEVDGFLYALREALARLRQLTALAV